MLNLKKIKHQIYITRCNRNKFVIIFMITLLLVQDKRYSNNHSQRNNLRGKIKFYILKKQHDLCMYGQLDFRI